MLVMIVHTYCCMIIMYSTIHTTASVNSLPVPPFFQINVVFLVIALVKVFQSKRRQTQHVESTATVNFTLFKLVAHHSIQLKKFVNFCYFSTGKSTIHTCLIHALYRALFRATVVLLPVLGLTWVFGLFAVNRNSTWLAWLFTIFNSLQVTLGTAHSQILPLSKQ